MSVLQLGGYLLVEHYRDGLLLATYDLGPGLVTSAGVNLMAADWTNASATIKLANWHDSGTTSNNANVADTALGSATGIARVTGTQSNTNNVYSSVGIIQYNGSYAITEWGLFTAPTSGTILDHRTFVGTPINVQNTQQLKFVYTLTFGAGG